jgi:hypothetical protein
VGGPKSVLGLQRDTSGRGHKLCQISIAFDEPADAVVASRSQHNPRSLNVSSPVEPFD